MNERPTKIDPNDLTPELRAKLNKFCEIERWHRAFLAASPAANGSIHRRSWEAAFREIPLTPEETRIYQQLIFEYRTVH